MEITDQHNTKILATIGPASSSYDVLLELIKAGVNIFRLNFSHSDHAEHLKVIKHINAINDKYNVHVGILADLQGPKIRIGNIKDNSLTLVKGDKIVLTTTPCEGTKDGIFMSYENFPKDVSPGEKVLINDGNFVFKVLETNKKDKVVLETVFGGNLTSKKGVNLPDTKISLPCLTEKDLRDLDFIMQHKINWIALSFVRSPKDVNQLATILKENNHTAKIIAKIEKPDAVKRINKIIKAADAIMVARGDLGVEVPMERLPSIQKQIIKKCIQVSKPVIVATQMMESMITNPSPTRAEITDVANAVLDGTDAVMLSAETSVGRHPVKVVKSMIKIISEAEKHYELKDSRTKPSKKTKTFLSDVVCFNACKTAEDIGAKAIVSLTASGYTAYKISSYRPNGKIFVFSHEHHMLKTLNLVWGVHCFFYDKFTTTDGTIEDVTEILKNKNKIKVGDITINTGSMPIHKRFRTNMLKVTVIE
jgi:pyruvate kinase